MIVCFVPGMVEDGDKAKRPSGEGDMEAEQRELPASWLELARQRGASIEVGESSMAPAVIAGSVVLVDDPGTEWLAGELYAVQTAEGVLLVRAGLDANGRRIMQHDNADWPPLPLPEGAEVMGRVRKVMRTLDE